MQEIRSISKYEELQRGDWVAVPYKFWHVSEGFDIMVAQITFINSDELGVSWMEGWSERHEDIKREDVIAIGSKLGKERIKLFRGANGFVILQPNHPALLAWQEEYKDR